MHLHYSVVQGRAPAENKFHAFYLSTSGERFTTLWYNVRGLILPALGREFSSTGGGEFPPLPQLGDSCPLSHLSKAHDYD